MLSVRVERDGQEPFVVEVKARDIAVWERGGRDRSFGSIRHTIKLSDLYEMVHVTLRRLGLDQGQTPDQFEAGADVIPVNDTSGVDPTQPGAFTEP